MIILKITKPNGHTYEEEFDTGRDALICTRYMPKGTRWELYINGKLKLKSNHE